MANILWRLLRWPYLELRVRKLRKELPTQKEALARGVITHIGYATQGWASLEVVLDLMNWCFIHHLPEREPFPVSLNRKLDLFRRAHRRIPELCEHERAGIKLADEIKLLSVKRHDMIHGYALGELSDDLIHIYRHIVPRGDNGHLLEAERHTYSQREFIEISSEIMDLTKRVVAHAHAVVATLGAEDKIYDLTRKAGVGAP